MDNNTILIVDDDPELLKLLQIELESANYYVLLAHDGREGLTRALTERPDLVILDVRLPRLDGLSVCRQLRAASTVPILMLSSLHSDYDKVIGLEVGADDYMGKPFTPRELLARVRALLRRAAPVAPAGAALPELRLGNLRLDRAGHEAWKADLRLALTPLEFALLEALMGARGRVLSRQQLLDSVWGEDFVGGERTVDTHVRNLRAKLGGDAPAIEAVRGIGFKLTPARST